MKIVILGNYKNLQGNKVEEAIQEAFEDFGHKVEAIHEKDLVSGKVSKEDIINKDADLFLFYKGATIFDYPSEELCDLLYRIPYKKACFYYDPINMFSERIEFMYRIADLTDFVFVTDGTFMRRHKFFNFYELKQGIRKSDCFKGKPKEEYKADVGFLGSLYGHRQTWAKSLKDYYGESFQVGTGVWDKELNDYLSSVKVVVSPRFPADDFYWSIRMYDMAGRGGCHIVPKLHGLTKEFTDGEDIVFYKDFDELIEKIDYYLEHDEEREKIKLNAIKTCKEKHTFHNTVENALKIICE